TTKRIGKSILEKTLTRWPVFVDHFTATVTLHWTGNAASEFSTYESGYHWIKAKITNSKNTYEKTIRTYVVKLPEKDS
ncbi:hypothetical protein P1S74_20050, partial [Escherichia coli]|nr:hypothetical protein [Escherichia coli]